MTQKADSSSNSGKDLPIESIATFPLPGMAIPSALAFTPDNSCITYLHSPERTLSQQLFLFDPADGQRRSLITPPDGGATEENLSLEEKLRRERMRQRGLGITSYRWSAKGSRLLLPLKGGIYVQDGLDGQLRQVLAAGTSPALDPRFSPDGEWIAFVKDNELHVVSAGGGTARQLTRGAHENGKSSGLAEYIAQEEMDRREGYWWSPDSTRIAFQEVDETHIPAYRIVHQGKDSVGSGAQEDHRYPFAGQANARVRLGVVPAEGGDPVWMELGSESDIYLARVSWLPDGRLSAQILNRTQDRLDLVVFDVATGRRSLLLREESSVWINLHNMFRPLSDGRFIWASERTGFQHLYLYHADGSLMRPLTHGDWMVDSIAGLDEKRGLVYFTGTRNDPREKQLYVVDFGGEEIRQITTEPGIHAITLDRAKERFIDVHHANGCAPEVWLRSLNGEASEVPVYVEKDPRLDELSLDPPELVTIENRAGTELHGALYRPAESFGPGPFPTIVWVYGGPHAQLVTDGWGLTVNMRAQYLSKQGFLVFVLDNRGSACRGLEFEGAIKHDMGNLEVEDQVDGVQWLIDQGLADPARVGVYGWSYGGYMALMCLARAPETFKVAVSGAPVTHWDGYDTCYTERYMGLPQQNPEGYERSSIMHHAENISGKLMLIHGLIDENVHFRHTARLINALIRHRKQYDLMLFPDERHGPRGLADRIYLEEQITDYFRRHL